MEPPPPGPEHARRELLVLAGIVLVVGLVLWLVVGDAWRALFPAPEPGAK